MGNGPWFENLLRLRDSMVKENLRRIKITMMARSCSFIQQIGELFLSC
jgi:hypothetical protein